MNSPTLLRDLLQPHAYAEMKAAQWKRETKPNDIALPELRGNNLVAFNSEEREVILHGPARTGKSVALLWKLHYFAEKYPGARLLMLRKTRESMSESTLVTFEQDVLKDNHPALSVSKREGRHSYQYPNGSEIIVAGLTANSKDQRAKIMSTEYDCIYVQEATELTLQEWEKLSTRLSRFNTPYRQIAGDCNPDAPSHWIWSRQLSGRLQFLQSLLRDNPRWHDGQDWTPEGIEYLATLGLLTGVTKDRLADGLWVQATGVIFDSWADGSANGNVTEEAEYVEGAGPILWVVDDGYSGQRDENTGLYTAESHPRVFLLVQCKPDGHLDIFYESHAIKKLSDVHIQEVIALGYPMPEYAILGPGFAELAGQLFKQGVYSRKVQANVEETIKEAQRMIASDKNGWRMIRANPRCRLLRSEMMSYIKDSQGKVVKAFDHAADGVRYLSWDKRHG